MLWLWPTILANPVCRPCSPTLLADNAWAYNFGRTVMMAIVMMTIDVVAIVTTTTVIKTQSHGGNRYDDNRYGGNRYDDNRYHGKRNHMMATVTTRIDMEAIVMVATVTATIDMVDSRPCLLTLFADKA